MLAALNGFLSLASLPATIDNLWQGSDLTLRTVFALAPGQGTIQAKYVPPITREISDKEITDFSAEFLGKRIGERIYLVSKKLPRLELLRRKYILATEVVTLLSSVSDSGTATLLPMRRLTPESQQTYADLAKEQFFIDADTPGILSQSFGFFINARVSFKTSIGNLKATFFGNPDTDPDLVTFGRVVNSTGTLTQNPRILYDRLSFPEVKSASYRIAIGVFPEFSLDADTAKHLGEVIEDVYRMKEAEYSANLEASAKALIDENKKYFNDILSKSPLSEAEVKRYLLSVKGQLLELGFSESRVENILQSARPSRRELHIFSSCYLRVNPEDKFKSGPATLYLWP